MTPQLREAIQAAQDRKALDMRVLDMGEVCSFTSNFLICSGTSTRHTQAICDGIVERLKKSGCAPAHVEGYSQADWILVDYLHFIVHIFVERAREFYDLERLWKNAPKHAVKDDAHKNSL
jgi:ribosome-associated protein